MAELDTDRIAAVALALVDARGVAGFTMRAVADQLGVTPMALYHHVKDKAALAALVVEAATLERPLPAAAGDWRDDLYAMARWMRESRMAHPNAGRLRNTYDIWTRSILQLTDRWMGLWRRSGLAHEAAARAATLSSLAISGFVDQELVIAEMAPPDAEMLAWLPNARLAFTSSGDRDAEFEMVVRAVIEGLHARAAAS